jgi:hypothetical protein
MIKKPRERGGHRQRWTAEISENKIIIIVLLVMM